MLSINDINNNNAFSYSWIYYFEKLFKFETRKFLLSGIIQNFISSIK